MADQVVLARMILGAPSDLSAATASLASINNSIAMVTEDDTLYKAIMTEAKANLEARLATKVAWFDTNFPANAPHSLVTGFYYNTSQGISDWEIRDVASTPVYRYSKETADVWSQALASNFPATGLNEPIPITWRQTISGFSQDCAWIRLGITGHSTGISNIVNVSIGERDGATQDIVGTQSFFTFSGSNRINVNPATTEYSDWLNFAIDNAKTYFITMSIENGYFKYQGAGGGFVRNGDYSLVEDWGVSGTAIAQTRGVTVIQGSESGFDPLWDPADTLTAQWITDWSAAYPMVWNNPFGTYYMLAALNQGQPLISTKKTLVTNRNPILAHYVTP